MMTKLTALAEPPTPAQGLVYMDAVLRPNRSLTQRGFLIVMIALALTSFLAGLGFWAVGAWPVVGFFGLDVALVYFAFRANFKAGARECETVRVTAEEVAVSRTAYNGQTGWWRVSPMFARVEIAQSSEHDADVRLAAGGSDVPLATCLSLPERLAFASALEQALHKARQERYST